MTINLASTQVSLFGAGITTPQGQRPHCHANLPLVVEWMHSPKLMQLTFDLRQIQDPKEQKAFKAQKLPFVTFAGTFSYRNEKGLIAYSGLAPFDFDHLGGIDRVRNAKEQLLADPYFDTALLFTSPLGDGIKWIVPIDLQRASYKQWYSAIVNYLHATYGLRADLAPSNPASACFLCYDPQMYINPEVEPF